MNPRRRTDSEVGEPSTEETMMTTETPEVPPPPPVQPEVVISPTATPMEKERARLALEEPGAVQPAILTPEALGGIPLQAYCRAKRIPEGHYAGMRAYTKTERATLEDWERIFANY